MLSCDCNDLLWGGGQLFWDDVCVCVCVFTVALQCVIQGTASTYITLCVQGNT